MSISPAAGRDGSPLTQWVRRHPIGAYLTWYFAVCWALTVIPTIVASNCLARQALTAAAGCRQGVRCWSIALRMIKSLCMQAVNATFFGLPALRRRA